MRFARLTLAAMVVGACASAASAQSVVFTNSQNVNAANAPFSLPLLSGSTVVVDPSGNLKLQCQLDPDGKRCLGMPTGGSGTPPPGAPGVTLSTTATDADTGTGGTQVVTGTSFQINPASLTNSPESCIRSSTPAASGWDGAALPGAAGATVSMSSVGDYTFKLRCFNAAGAGEGTITLSAIQGSQPPPDNGDSSEPAACNSIRAATGANSFTRVTNTQVISGTTNQSAFRNLSTLRGLYGGKVDSSLYFFKTAGGQYIAMQFKGSELEQDIFQSAYSPGGQQHSGQPMAGTSYMTISKCSGDFRIRTGSNAAPFTDPYMACSSDVNSGIDNQTNFNLGNAQSTATFIPSGNTCTLDRNATYYVNIVFANPNDGLQSGEIDCGGGAAVSCGYKYGTL